MRNRTWSDVVMATMIALCVAVVAEPQRSQPASANPDAMSTPAVAPNLADAARSLAVAVLLTGERPADAQAEKPAVTTRSAADRAMANAAQAAGDAASNLEMPFFSFGGDASAE